VPNRRKRPPFPTREQIIDFVRDSDEPVGRREIARAFRITGHDREALKSVVRELERDGLIGEPRRRHGGGQSGLPPVAVLEVTGLDDDGEPLARPHAWSDDRAPPRIHLVPASRRSPAPAPGDRVLARLTRLDDGDYEGRVMRRLDSAPPEIVGIFQLVAGHGRLYPVNRRIRTEFAVDRGDSATARPGDIVRAESLSGRRHGMARARIVERLGPSDGPGYASLIAAAENEIPIAFGADALELARRAGPAPLDGRVDLRDVALVTIDDSDARDFDDAVWAEPDPEPGNDGGWHLLVAIADVAWYVRPGDALDRCARERGNSVYFPDRVAPMLPEELSNFWCSLKPGEDRPCLAVHFWIDRAGRLVRHRFVRAMMRSAARLTYDQAQSAIDGAGAPTDVADVMAPLYGAYRALRTAREARGAIDLDLPERRIEFAPDGTVSAIGPRRTLDSHRLIEELMIAANVAAAETLAAPNRGGLFRVHDSPPPDKLDELREFLATLDIRIDKGQAIRPRVFRAIVERVRGTALAPIVDNAVLRSQAKAVYSPHDTGHFGLALRNYAHFTSPIRRHADLEVHRALIAALDLGEGGAAAGIGTALDEIAEHVSMTERRAARAERGAADRLCAEFLSNRIDAEFDGRIVDAIRSAIFVRLDDTGAEGLLPLSHAGDERFRFDPARHAFVGARSREWLRPGDPIRLRLIEADRVTGRLVFARVQTRDGRTRDRPRWRQ
jgi:ribonuclease R